MIVIINVTDSYQEYTLQETIKLAWVEIYN